MYDFSTSRQLGPKQSTRALAIMRQRSTGSDSPASGAAWSVQPHTADEVLKTRVAANNIKGREYLDEF
jgi:hypothetical protein